eukprot:3905362-Rhodomonas_salina.1
MHVPLRARLARLHRRLHAMLRQHAGAPDVDLRARAVHGAVGHRPHPVMLRAVVAAELRAPRPEPFQHIRHRRPSLLTRHCLVGAGGVRLAAARLSQRPVLQPLLQVLLRSPHRRPRQRVPSHFRGCARCLRVVVPRRSADRMRLPLPLAVQPVERPAHPFARRRIAQLLPQILARGPSSWICMLASCCRCCRRRVVTQLLSCLMPRLLHARARTLDFNGPEQRQHGLPQHAPELRRLSRQVGDPLEHQQSLSAARKLVHPSHLQPLVRMAPAPLALRSHGGVRHAHGLAAGLVQPLGDPRQRAGVDRSRLHASCLARLVVGPARHGLARVVRVASLEL